MELPLGLNYLDVVLLLILFLFAVRGMLRGFLNEIAGLVGLGGGVLLAGRWYGTVGAHLQVVITNADWAYMLAYVLIIIGCMLAVALIARLLHKVLTVACADWIDHAAGFAAGGLKGLFVCIILVGLLDFFLHEASFVSTSQVAPGIRTATGMIKGYIPQSVHVPGLTTQ